MSGKLEIIAVGRKAEASFNKRNYRVVTSYPGFFDNLSYELSSELMSEVRKKFVEGYYDQVLIGFNEFKSVIAQNRSEERRVGKECRKRGWRCQEEIK